MKRILLLILALVLTLALMACRSKEPEDTADAVDNSTLSNSAQLSMTEASYLEYDNGQITCRFRKDEDGWKWVDNEAFPAGRCLHRGDAGGAGRHVRVPDAGGARRGGGGCRA